MEQSLSQDPDKIATACETFFVDVLLMDVGRPTEKSLDRRMEAILRSKKKNTTMKAGLLCDNASDPEIAQKSKTSKGEWVYRRILLRVRADRLPVRRCGFSLSKLQNGFDGC